MKQSAASGLATTPTKSEFGTQARVRATQPRYMEILDFLWEEAATLDRDDLAGWRDMLDADIHYYMPVCLTRKRGSGDSFETEAMHYDEDFGSLTFRVRRFLETQAWAADPPSRARRFVTGVRVWEGRGEGMYDVASSLLLVRSMDDDFRTDLITAERRDRIRFSADGAPLLLERKILCDQTTIGTHNLAIFL
jgi:3-phenylpropionate/cinnamic acid dioxygenase small subunit